MCFVLEWKSESHKHILIFDGKSMLQCIPFIAALKHLAGFFPFNDHMRVCVGKSFMRCIMENNYLITILPFNHGNSGMER